jgi:peroxiredoxin
VELPGAPAIGALAPDFALDDIAGQTESRTTFAGKPMFITFFHSWRPVCNANAPEFRAAEQFCQDDAVFVHVSEQELLIEVQGFANKYGLESPMLMDPSGVSYRLSLLIS